MMPRTRTCWPQAGALGERCETRKRRGPEDNSHVQRFPRALGGESTVPAKTTWPNGIGGVSVMAATRTTPKAIAARVGRSKDDGQSRLVASARTMVVPTKTHERDFAYSARAIPTASPMARQGIGRMPFSVTIDNADTPDRARFPTAGSNRHNAGKAPIRSRYANDANVDRQCGP